MAAALFTTTKLKPPNNFEFIKMEHTKNIIGGSLPVPCVQELVKKTLTKVPERYIHANQDPLITNHTTPLPEFPVIDMQKLLVSGEVGSKELQSLHSACKEWGFFQMINHGVSSEVVEKVKVESEGLFQLPMEEKKKLWQREGDYEGFGQTFVMSEEQKLEWGDMFYITAFPVHHRKPHLFPHLPQSFRKTIEEYSKGVRELQMQILMSMVKALKMEEEDMIELFEEGLQGIRVNYYPPCPQPELVIGRSPHFDGVGMTILLQVNDTDGLEIKKDDMWIPVKPLPDAFIINIGDILEMVTNGIYRSVEHRALINSTKERISIAAFHSPTLDGDMGPAPSLITPQIPAIFRRMTLIDYLKGRGPPHLRDKSKYFIR